MELLAPAAAACTPSAAMLGLGMVLRKSICDETDGETATKFALWLTLPALVLTSFNKIPLSEVPLFIPAAFAAVTACSAAIAWILSRNLHPKERGLLAGTSIGSTANLLAAPLAGALFGLPGLRIALLCSAVSMASAQFASYLLFSSAGAAFPENYQHTDGGAYRGEWKGMLKEGYGVYTYPSKARYEGEWREGLKDGRGVYHFPKGGLYEGEWRRGVMTGLGVRTYASGKVTAGVWENGKLVQSMEEWQCALAVEGANDAATVAKRVMVGSASVGSAVRRLAAQPVTWALLAMAVLGVLRAPLTPTLELVAGKLAEAHAPLSLIAVGLSLDLAPAESRQIKPIGTMLAIRLLPPLLVALTIVLAAPYLGWGVSSVLAALGPAVICAAAPVHPTALKYAHMFRLNENLAAALTRVSSLWAIMLMPLLGVAASVSYRVGNGLPFAAALAAASVAVASTALLSNIMDSIRKDDNRNAAKVLMVYQGPVAAEAASEKSSKAAGTGQEESSSSAPSTNKKIEGSEGGTTGPVADVERPAKPRFKDVDGPGSLGSGGQAAAALGGGGAFRRAPAPVWSPRGRFIRSIRSSVLRLTAPRPRINAVARM